MELELILTELQPLELSHVRLAGWLAVLGLTAL